MFAVSFLQAGYFQFVQQKALNKRRDHSTQVGAEAKPLRGHLKSSRFVPCREGGGGSFGTEPRIRSEFVWTHAECMPEVCTATMVTSANGGSEHRVLICALCSSCSLISTSAFLSVSRMLVMCLFFWSSLVDWGNWKSFVWTSLTFFKFKSKATSKGLRNLGSCVTSKMWGSSITGPSSTTTKFPSCQALALLSTGTFLEHAQKDGFVFFFFFFFFFFFKFASVKKANLHPGVLLYARTNILSVFRQGLSCPCSTAFCCICTHLLVNLRMVFANNTSVFCRLRVG